MLMFKNIIYYIIKHLLLFIFIQAKTHDGMFYAAFIPIMYYAL